MEISQIPSHIGHYLSGFADGEGSFMITVRKREDYVMKWKISLCFNVSQKESYILSQFKKHLECGTLRRRIDDFYYYEVNNFNAISSNVIPFFTAFPFLSQNKQLQFSLFVRAAKIIASQEHLSERGFQDILSIRNRMNRGGNRRNFPSIKGPQRLHARPQHHGDDIVRPLEKFREWNRNDSIHSVSNV